MCGRPGRGFTQCGSRSGSDTGRDDTGRDVSQAPTQDETRTRRESGPDTGRDDQDETCQHCVRPRHRTRRESGSDTGRDVSQALTQDETCQHSVRPRHRTRRYMTRRASSVSGRTRRANSVTLAVAINNYHHPSAADVQTRTAITGNLVFVMHVLNTLQNIAIDAELCSLVFF